MKTYRIVFIDNTGSEAIDAIATTVGGQWRDCVSSFDGKRDLGFIDIDDESAEYLEELLDDDKNVVSYQEREYVAREQ